MMRPVKKLISGLMALVMVMTMLPMNVFADQTQISGQGTPIGQVQGYPDETITIEVDETIVLTKPTQGEGKWKVVSGKDCVDDDDEEDGNLQVEGEKPGAATIVFTWKNDGKKYSKTYHITVTAKAEAEVGTYALYFYGLIPGKVADDSTQNANAKWFGLGVGTISNVPDPATLNHGNASVGGTVTAPDSYPDLVIDGKTYSYGTGYTLEPWRVRVAPGANTGNNKHNPTVDAGTNTYHYDHRVILNQTEDDDEFLVQFMVQDPGFDDFATVDAYYVDEGTSERSLTKPSPESVEYNGFTYEFDGWYRDEACTQKASFDGTINANTKYYGKYVSVTATYKVEHYLQNLDNDQYTKDTNATQTLTGSVGAQTAAQAKTYTGFTAKSFEQKTIKADGTTVVKIYYNRNTYTVTYTDGVEGVEVFKDQVNSDVRYGAATPGFGTNPTRTGYVFAGWKDADGNAPATTVTADATYYAQWEKDDSQTQDTKYTVRYTIEGTEQTKDKVEETGTAWVNDNPAQIAIAEGGIPAPANKYTGYKLDPTNPKYPAAGTLVNSGAEYTVNYVQKVSHISVVKTITNFKDIYDIGDEIDYSITVTNDGDLTETNLTITDQLINATGNVNYGAGWANGVYTVDKLDPGQSVTVTCSYKVRDLDAGREIFNRATVRRDGGAPVTDESEGAQVINLYNLAIVYVDANTGYALAETYLAKLKAGTPFYVESPFIEGYTTKVLAVQSDADGMPAHDLSIAVVYTPIAPEEEPEEEPKKPEVNVVTPTEDGGYDLTPISELDTPLANMDLGDHTCCIMHFLLMLASLITLAFYTDSRKKHQARIHQLKESLKAEGKNDPSEKM